MNMVTLATKKGVCIHFANKYNPLLIINKPNDSLYVTSLVIISLILSLTLKLLVHYNCCLCNL